MGYGRLAWVALVLSMGLSGCASEPSLTPLSYCSETEGVEALGDCMDQSFAFYQRLVDSTHDFVVLELEEALNSAKNDGQERRFRNLQERHQADFNEASAALEGLETDFYVRMVSEEGVGETGVESVENEASQAIERFEESAEKTLKKL